MTLGTYAEISTTVPDDEAATAFYEQLGFKHAGYRVFTDGKINLNLAPAGVPNPLLRYAESDVEAVLALDVGAKRDHRGLVVFTTPEGLTMMLSPYQSRVPLPEGTPVSRLGTFGEYALPVKDMHAALAYWEKLGFARKHVAEEPYPWAIVSDDILTIGLHQTNEFNGPHLTYFAPDMLERIAALQADHVPVTMIPSGDGGQITGPGGVQFFLFVGAL